MTAIVILNIVFAVFVVGGMLSLLGWAIVRDARARGARIAPSIGILRLRPQPRSQQAHWRRELDPAR
jgi:hypothetical protein